MALTQTATNAFKVGLMNKTYGFSTDTFKIALYSGLATLNADTAAYITDHEIIATGYTAGGATLTVTTTPTTAPSGNIAYISFGDVSWNAALTARGALIYKADGITNPSVCVLDFGADKTSTTVFEIKFPVATNVSAIIRIS